MPAPDGVTFLLWLASSLPGGRWTTGLIGLALILWGFFAGGWIWSLGLWGIGGFLALQAWLSHDT